MNSNQNLLRLLFRSLKSNKKLSEFEENKKKYNQDLKEIQQKYLVEFNKTENFQEVAENLHVDMNKLHQKDEEKEEESKEKIVTVEKIIA